MVVFCQLFDHSLHLLLQLLHPETQKHWVSTHGCFRWNSTRCDNREETNKPQSHLHQRVLAQVGLRLHATGHQRKNFLWQLFLQLEDKQTDTYFCHFQTSFWETGRKRMCLVMMTDFVCVSCPAPEIALMFTLMALSISMVTSFSMLISWLDRFSSCFLTWWTFLKKKKKQKSKTSTLKPRGAQVTTQLPACLSLPHPLLALGDEKTVLHCALVCEQSPGLTRVKDQLLSVGEKQKHCIRKKAEPDGGHPHSWQYRNLLVKLMDLLLVVRQTWTEEMKPNHLKFHFYSCDSDMLSV